MATLVAVITLTLLATSLDPQLPPLETPASGELTADNLGIQRAPQTLVMELLFGLNCASLRGINGGMQPPPRNILPGNFWRYNRSIRQNPFFAPPPGIEPGSARARGESVSQTAMGAELLTSSITGISPRHKKEGKTLAPRTPRQHPKQCFF